MVRLLHCGVAILLLGMAKAPCVAATSAGITRDERAVFVAVLSSGCQRADQGFYVVSDLPVSTKDHPDPSKWPASIPWTELAAPVPNAVRWPHVGICAANRIVDGQKVHSIFERDARIRTPPSWDPFYAEFPGAKGLIRVSVPVFTPDRRHAAVYLETTCNSLCGTGFYIELVREKAGWRVLRHESAWIS